MIKVLVGSNDFMRLSELRLMTSEFVESHGDFGLEKIDAGEVDLGRILESVSSLPFLSERRMIILTNIANNKSLMEDIDKLFDSVSDTTNLIINEQKLDKRLTSYKTIKKRTELVEFNELSEQDLLKWVAQEVSKKGGEVNTNTAQYLLSKTGLNQMVVASEIDKLLSYEKTITKQNIDKLVEGLPSSTVFDLIDSAFAGNKKRALGLYEEQRMLQVEAQAIMGMVAWQLHVLSVVKLNENLPPNDIAKQAKLNPFVVRKSLGLASKMSRNYVKELVGRALKLDVRLKSEMIDADDAVQHFLLTI